MKRLHREPIKKMVLPYAAVDITCFSEQDIITLHDILLTPGFHELQVTSLDKGRTILKTFLRSLGYYQESACLSMNKDLPLDIFNMYEYMLSAGYISPENNAFDSLFAQDFTSDFLWIELTQELLEQPWLGHFEQALVNWHINTHIPIVKLIQR